MNRGRKNIKRVDDRGFPGAIGAKEPDDGRVKKIFLPSFQVRGGRKNERGIPQPL